MKKITLLICMTIAIAHGCTSNIQTSSLERGIWLSDNAQVTAFICSASDNSYGMWLLSAEQVYDGFYELTVTDANLIAASDTGHELTGGIQNSIIIMNLDEVPTALRLNRSIAKDEYILPFMYDDFVIDGKRMQEYSTQDIIKRFGNANSISTIELPGDVKGQLYHYDFGEFSFDEYGLLFHAVISDSGISFAHGITVGSTDDDVFSSFPFAQSFLDAYYSNTLDGHSVIYGYRRGGGGLYAYSEQLDSGGVAFVFCDESGSMSITVENGSVILLSMGLTMG